MYAWIFCHLALVSLALVLVYAVCTWLTKPPEHGRLSARVPSLTNSLWSEIRFSLTVAMKQPKDLLPLYKEMIHNTGPVIHFRIAGRSYVILNDPDDIKILLSNKQNIDKGLEYDLLRPWLNEGLLVSKGEKWQNRRKLLTGTFHFKTLDAYNPSINKHSRVLVKKLLEASARDNGVSVAEFVTLCSLDIICETIMGTEMNAQEGQSVQYVQSIKSACRSVHDRIFKFWLRNDFIFRISESGRQFYKSIKVLHDYTDNVIKNKRMSLIKDAKDQKERTENKYEKMQKKSFLDILLNVLEEYPDQMTDKDIREEVDTFLFEGHDTSALAINMTLLLLGMHPDVQDRARDELLGIFGDSDRDATMEDLNAMKYVEAVIKESLRLYPSVPGFTRELKTALQIKNYIIPPKTTVCVIPFIIHRNEEIYPNANDFVPERFLDENSKSKLIFGYIPFSAGPRNCIGQKYAMNQMKIVVSTVLRKAKIESLGNKEDIDISLQLIVRIESVPKVKFYEIK